MREKKSQRIQVQWTSLQSKIDRIAIGLVNNIYWILFTEYSNTDFSYVFKQIISKNEKKLKSKRKIEI